MKEKPSAEVRLDKWLWAARFYKTRALAREMVEGGKVHYNGQRSKPSKIVELNATSPFAREMTSERSLSRPLPSSVARQRKPLRCMKKPRKAWKNAKKWRWRVNLTR